MQAAAAMAQHVDAFRNAVGLSYDGPAKDDHREDGDDDAAGGEDDGGTDNDERTLHAARQGPRPQKEKVPAPSLFQPQWREAARRKDVLAKTTLRARAAERMALSRRGAADQVVQ